jgi:hypothetical protein
MNDQNLNRDKDPELWQLARARASFKRHLLNYVVFSIFFWIIWYFTGAHNYGGIFPWPVWPMFGWGIGIVFHYIRAYVSTGTNSAEEEYQKLIQKKHQQ